MAELPVEWLQLVTEEKKRCSLYVQRDGDYSFSKREVLTLAESPGIKGWSSSLVKQKGSQLVKREGNSSSWQFVPQRIIIVSNLKVQCEPGSTASVFGKKAGTISTRPPLFFVTISTLIMCRFLPNVQISRG